MLTKTISNALILVLLGYCGIASARFLSPDPISLSEKVVRASVPYPGLRVRDEAALYGIAALANAHMPQPPLELNPYVYTVNNPLRWVDPDGQNTIALGGGIGFTVGGPPGAVVGGLIGAGVGVGIYVLCSKEKTEEERCKEVKNNCIEKCSKFGLPSSDGTGTSFRRCIRNCMERENCFNF